MIDWQVIDTVLLDMDGTLLDLHYDNHFWLTHLPKRYADIHAVSIEAAEQALHNHIRAIEGTLNWYCLDYWSEQLQLNVAELKKETRDRIQERPHAARFLALLKHNNKAVYLVTNSHPAGIELKLTETSIRPYLDDIVCSHQFQRPKEDSGFWQALQAHIPFNKERTLFVDDNLSVLNTAAAFGIKHILGIHQPDSQQQRRLDKVTAIDHFDEIWNGLEQPAGWAG